jgi:hypothetical protein
VLPALSIAHLDARGDRAGKKDEEKKDEENGSHKRSNEVNEIKTK